MLVALLLPVALQSPRTSARAGTPILTALAGALAAVALSGWWMPQGNPGYVPVTPGKHSFAEGLLPWTPPTAPWSNVPRGRAVEQAGGAGPPDQLALLWSERAQALAEPLYSNLWIAGMRGTWERRWETVLALLGDDPWAAPGGPARVAEVFAVHGVTGCVDVHGAPPSSAEVLLKGAPSVVTCP